MYMYTACTCTCIATTLLAESLIRSKYNYYSKAVLLVSIIITYSPLVYVIRSSLFGIIPNTRGTTSEKFP